MRGMRVAAKFHREQPQRKIIYAHSMTELLSYYKPAAQCAGMRFAQRLGLNSDHRTAFIKRTGTAANVSLRYFRYPPPPRRIAPMPPRSAMRRSVRSFNAGRVRTLANSPIFLELAAFTPSVAELCPPGSLLGHLSGKTTNHAAAAASDEGPSCRLHYGFRAH
jgi:hypothetical protein